MVCKINQKERIVSLEQQSKIGHTKPATLDNTVSKISKNFLLEIDKAIGERSSSKTNQPNLAATQLVNKNQLAPYFTLHKNQLNVAQVVVLILLAIITKAGKDPADTQSPIDLENIQVSGLNINQLLEIRENSLNK